MQILTVLMLQAVVIAHTGPPVAKPCGPVLNEQAQVARQIAEAVRGGDADRMMTVATALHGQGERGKRTRDATILELMRWEHDSQGLQPLEACAEKDRTVFRYANTLTDAVDELRLTFEGDRVKRVSVAPAIRLQPTAQARGTRNPVTELDRYVQMLAARDLFSGVVVVSRRGKLLYQRAFGFADKASQRPNTIGTMFNLASTNKIFTAAAIMRLVEDKRLSLSTTLAQVLPSDVAGKASASVRIDQLLSHTSGLNSSFDALSFAPGTSYSYSSFGFVVLGKVIEAVSKLSYEDFLRLHVLGPAQMPRTGIYDAATPVEWLSTGYTAKLEGNKLVYVENPLLHTYAGNPAGGFWSDASELLRFAGALQAGRLLKTATVGLMRRAKPQLGAPEYGFGVMRWRAPGVWGHGGDLPGTDADLEIYCDTGTVVIVLANRDNVNAPVLTRARELFFTGRCNSAD